MWRRYEIVRKMGDVCARKFCPVVEQWDELVDSDDGTLVDHNDASAVVCELIEGIKMAMQYIEDDEIKQVLSSLLKETERETGEV